MWQRFTESARKVVFYAQEEAQRFGEGHVSTEHLLLGIVRAEGCTAVRVLEAMGVSPERVREEVNRRLSPGDTKPSQDMTLTPRAKRIIDLAYHEARNLGNNYIGTEHLLLGLIAEQDGVAGQALQAVAVDLERAREEAKAIQAREPRREDPPATKKAPPNPVVPPSDPWAGIDPFARRAVVFAEMEALRRGQAHLSPEHLLLGLLREPESAAVRALAAMGIDLDVLRDAASAACRDSGTPLKGEAVLSPATGNAFRIAYQEQTRLRARELGAEHLLIGLLIEPDGVARHVLEGMGVDADRARAAILALAREQ